MLMAGMVLTGMILVVVVNIPSNISNALPVFLIVSGISCGLCGFMALQSKSLAICSRASWLGSPRRMQRMSTGGRPKAHFRSDRDPTASAT